MLARDCKSNPDAYPGSQFWDRTHPLNDLKSQMWVSENGFCFTQDLPSSKFATPCNKPKFKVPKHTQKAEIQRRIATKGVKSEDIKHEGRLSESQVASISKQQAFNWLTAGKWSFKNFERWLKAKENMIQSENRVRLSKCLFGSPLFG